MTSDSTVETLEERFASIQRLAKTTNDIDRETFLARRDRLYKSYTSMWYLSNVYHRQGGHRWQGEFDDDIHYDQEREQKKVEGLLVNVKELNKTSLPSVPAIKPRKLERREPRNYIEEVILRLARMQLKTSVLISLYVIAMLTVFSLMFLILGAHIVPSIVAAATILWWHFMGIGVILPNRRRVSSPENRVKLVEKRCDILRRKHSCDIKLRHLDEHQAFWKEFEEIKSSSQRALGRV